ncbi:alpha/beta fold hydrolase [Microbacterium murale]|uniref:Pimeloyl-ACP methyl ester carboxylesterase n=1 Tax=Microbacterium murale TaxID=1081040 RepID=A0ABU0P708_9MICO|nr:alpha/beta fold hydrolase [Microbacterium murale]MDQ0643120.1 pimeloyl-ACP methyl ester carboxylesterase [Microbacterium murale]
MDVILVPGLWLDSSSWQEVSDRLREAGHVPHPLTLRGLTSRTADRSGVMLADHVALIVNTIDQMGGPVALVGHAEACGLVHAAANRRPDRVARTFHVGGLPSADGTYVLTGFAADSHHDTADIARRCAVDDALAALRERQRTGDGQGIDTSQRLTDDRRYDVPATVIASEYTSEDVRRWMTEPADPATELARIRDVTLVDLPAGHWPQFERSADLTRIIVDALADDARSAA